MRSVVTIAVAGFAMLVPVAAPAAQEPELKQAQLQRQERELQDSRDRMQRLLELRLRHDLGLPAGNDESWFRFEGNASAEANDRARRQLESEDLTTAGLLQRYNKLKAQVQQLQEAAAAVAARNKAEQEEWVVVPRPDNGGSIRRVPGAAPLAEVKDQPPVPPAPTQIVALAELSPVIGQIHGTEDHGTVARALFGSAEHLVARADGMRERDAAAAKALDVAAKDRLERALDALRALIERPAPAYQDLFLQGRCRELLFRLDERHGDLSLRDKPAEYQRREQEVRAPFVAITARDVVAGQGSETLGTWGRAAQTALEHFRWMNLHGNYNTKQPLESIKWGRQAPKR